jgi:tripartite-type tricarboxylate transporter receptor subunit TctC
MKRTMRMASALLLPSILGAAAMQVAAQEYPNKPVRVIVPLAPGGATDIQARLYAQKLGQTLGQTFLVDNRSGAGGMIAFKYMVSQANTDGYTVLATSAGITNVPALYEKPPFDPVKDFEPIALMSKAPYLLIVNPQFPAATMKDFLAWARAHPGKLDFAISGIGTTIHLAQVWLADAGAIKMATIPYKGTGPATQDVIAGRVHASFANPISAGQHVRTGRVRAVAVTSAERSAALPDLPTFAESGLTGFDVTTWHGWLGPKGTPRSIVQRLNAELNRTLKDPVVARAVAEEGGVIVGGPPEAFRRHIAEEVERWKRLVRIAGIKPIAD